MCCLGPTATLLGDNGKTAVRGSLRVEGSEEDDVAAFLKRIWKRHSNPWSVWTRILSYPLVYVPIWNRSWKQGVAVAAWFAANPVLFPAPEGDESWATRGVLGEELWTAERPWDLSMLINTASAAFFAGGLFASYRRRSWPMVFFASVALLLKLWYIDRMTFYYVQNREREEPAEDAGVAPTSPSW
jgi:hypothetical protein